MLIAGTAIIGDSRRAHAAAPLAKIGSKRAELPRMQQVQGQTSGAARAHRCPAALPDHRQLEADADDAAAGSLCSNGAGRSLNEGRNGYSAP